MSRKAPQTGPKHAQNTAGAAAGLRVLHLHAHGLAQVGIPSTGIVAGDIELWAHLRALNSGERGMYDHFWEAGEKVMATLITCAAENRHGNERTFMQPLSVPEFRRRVVEQLEHDGHAGAAVPSDVRIGFQFQPPSSRSGPRSAPPVGS